MTTVKQKLEAIASAYPEHLREQTLQLLWLAYGQGLSDANTEFTNAAKRTVNLAEAAMVLAKPRAAE